MNYLERNMETVCKEPLTMKEYRKSVSSKWRKRRRCAKFMQLLRKMIKND